MAVDHYSKWVEARLVVEHGVAIIAEFFKEKIICKYGLPKYVFIDNASKWVEEFFDFYKKYAIQHQHTSLTHLKCNGVIEWLIRTIKHGLTN